MDEGNEFAGKVSAALKQQCGINRKNVTTRNPQSNGMFERIHQVVGNMMRTRAICRSKDLDEDSIWHGVSAAVRHAVNSMVHMTNCATPTQLLFDRDAMLDILFEAD